ncbi:MAG TPA: SPOR domain-containing protein [Vicingus sp.]|nr:MAG: SPOR domain-containing protein [Flavobacteriales bacterium]HRP60246.1 SPOR domain-containing protein [Vicingus sp.]
MATKLMALAMNIKNTFLPLLFSVIINSVFANNVEVENRILKSEENKYHISTTIFSKEHSGVLRLTITIPDEYTFVLFNDPNLLIDSRNNVIKFYTNFESENKIEIHFQLIKKSDEATEASIPTHTEFTLNGEMVVIDKEIVLSSSEFISNNEMDSISNYFEEKSKQYASKDVVALNNMKNLPSSSPETKEKSKKEDLTSMATGYNSSTSSGLSNDNKFYSVQILSLQFYNEKRFLDFLASYKIKPSETYKKEINGVVKIYVGKFQSYEEAKLLKEKLVKEKNLTDSFIVSY